MAKPDKYIRIATVDRDGNPILNHGEGAVEYDGVYYVIDNQITLQQGPPIQAALPEDLDARADWFKNRH